MWTLILDLLFPRRCLSCGQSGRLACDDCLGRLSPPLKNKVALAVWSYDEPLVRKIIWKLKYSGLASLAAELAPHLLNNILEEVSERAAFSGQKILVVPVPLSKQRLKERGYNQAARLAQSLAQLLPAHLEYAPRLLVKVKDTPSQVTMKSRQARLQNLRGAFAVTDANQAENRTVLIIDDVLTTGATIEEVARTLKAAGVKDTLAAVLAHGE